MSSDSDSNDVQLLDHSYDGIQEYDNPLPSWWLTTFLATIIFSFNYFIHYTFVEGNTQADELQAEMQALPKVSAEQNWNEEDLKAQMALQESLQNGKAVFGAKCSMCHGPEGQGTIGPNLTDNFWLYGQGTRADLMSIIHKGVTDKGMPAWSEMISEKEIVQVAGFVYSLRGTSPQNPKAAQGAEVKE
ncbi:MAG: cbb3-type cytochrome c oxidase N-terminal domain-containing protein [Pseudobdellovibrionaceae bacterium]